MKKVLMTGVGVFFLAGVVALFLKWLIWDTTLPFFSPMITPFLRADKQFLAAPLTFALIAAMIVLAGFIFSRRRVKRFTAAVLKKIPQDIENSRGALVEIADGTYVIAAKIGKTKILRTNGQTESYYILYAPSSPIPWSGLPIIFAKEEKVMLLIMPFREIYFITASFGKATPELIEELGLKC